MKTAFRTAAALFSAAAVYVAAAAQAETLNYTVTRDGNAIGTHSVTIDGDAATTHVAIDTDIEVKVLFVTAYKFKHTSSEEWQNGQLMSISSTTDDDGTAKALTVRAENGRLTVDSSVKGQERRQYATAGTLPASLWNPAIVRQAALLNTLDGQMMKIRVEDKGQATIEAGGQNVSAHHYAISGELTRELWFDADGRLVRMRFPDKTNSEIVYALN